MSSLAHAADIDFVFIEGGRYARWLGAHDARRSDSYHCECDRESQLEEGRNRLRHDSAVSTTFDITKPCAHPSLREFTRDAAKLPAPRVATYFVLPE
jgi:hypothetical protein